MTKSSIKHLLPLLIQTAIGIVMLLVGWMIISILPMIDEVDLPLEFSLSELLSAIVLTVLIVLLIDFTLKFSRKLDELNRSSKELYFLEDLFKYVIYLIAIVIAYIAYLPLVVPYLNDFDWIYSLFFLLISIIIIGIIGYSVYNNSQKLGQLLVERRSIAASKDNPDDTGSGVEEIDFYEDQEEEEEEEEEDAGVESSVETGEATEPVPEEDEPQNEPDKCPSCENILREGANFCNKCGTSVS